MPPKEQSARRPDRSREIRDLGWSVILISSIVMLMTLLGVFQAGYPPMGEIGNFVFQVAFFVVPLSAWGFVTGIGLRHAWRWARISMLLFGWMVTVFCASPAVLFFFAPAWHSWSLKNVGLRAAGLLFFIPSALVYRRFRYFRREDVRSYFR